MLNKLIDYKNSIEVNGIKFTNAHEAIKHFSGFNGPVKIILNKKEQVKENKKEVVKNNEVQEKTYRIKVRQYMTKHWDFNNNYNAGIPVPMRVMVGKELQETKGMVKMELWGEITEKFNSHCMRCGKQLTNNVSKYLGIGPECGGHGYVNPFNTQEELKEAVKQMNKQLKEVKWTGWIIKSAIEEKTLLNT